MDIIVIIDEQLRSKGKGTVETADVIKTAGCVSTEQPHPDTSRR